MSNEKITVLEHGGEMWVRVDAVHPLRDRIVELEASIEREIAVSRAMTRSLQEAESKLAPTELMLGQRTEQCSARASEVRKAQTIIDELDGKLAAARMALRDIMSRSNPQEWHFQRAHEALKEVGFPK